MSKGKHSEAEMIGALKQLEAGRRAEDVGREMGVSKLTIYVWKAKYGGLDANEAQRLWQLEDENHRLKKLVHSPRLWLNKVYRRLQSERSFPN